MPRLGKNFTRTNAKLLPRGKGMGPLKQRPHAQPDNFTGSSPIVLVQAIVRMLSTR